MGILDNPLVPIAGAFGSSKRVTVLMHEGYEYDEAGEFADMRLEPGLHLVMGNLDNPLASWPVYALVEDVA